MNTYHPNHTVIFAGPTISVDACKEILNAIYKPPVEFGDIYGLIGTSIRRILVIDGFFYNHASVWHREIIEAIRNGISVYGCSSMGALRAAELHCEGMIGIGQVFEWIVDGTIRGDDEVAVAHEASFPFLQFTVPLVNIRYALNHALTKGVVSEIEAADILDIARSISFQERTQELFLKEVTHTLGNALGQRIRDLWREGIPDIKRKDAVSALQRLSYTEGSIHAFDRSVHLHRERGRARRLMQWGNISYVHRFIRKYPFVFLQEKSPEQNSSLDNGLIKRLDKAKRAAAQLWLIEMTIDWEEGFSDPDNSLKEKYTESIYESLNVSGRELELRCNSVGISFVELVSEINRRAQIHYYLNWLRRHSAKIGDCIDPGDSTSQPVSPLDCCVWPIMHGTDLYLTRNELGHLSKLAILRLLIRIGMYREEADKHICFKELDTLLVDLPGILGYKEWQMETEAIKILVLSDLIKG